MESSLIREHAEKLGACVQYVAGFRSEGAKSEKKHISNEIFNWGLESREENGKACDETESDKRG